MRYFQKALRRADLPFALSAGFSPHMQMSFAAPLGVGKTSSGEYFDLDLRDDDEQLAALTSASFTERLNAQMADGITVESTVKIPETKAAKGMTVVAAADYTVSFRKGRVSFPENTKELLAAFLDLPEIRVVRKTKRSEAEVDIHPWIYKLRMIRLDDETLANHPSGVEAERIAFRMTLATGSVHNLKPDLVLQAFAANAGFSIAENAMLIHRNNILADIGEEGNRKLVALDALGEEF
jgi:radical SAM-linked protein